METSEQAFNEKIIMIDGYLVQKKLESVLQTIVGELSWVGKEIRVEDTRFRWDIVYKQNERMVAVEFDGSNHYRHSLNIKRDNEKDVIAQKSGIKVVRFPYWIQLTTETLRSYFNLDATIKQNFPHGFIATKDFPASFCELGIRRFKNEYDHLSPNVQNAVANSLRDRITEYGLEYVLPKQLYFLIDKKSS